MRARFALPFVTMIVLVCTILLVEAERGSSAPQKGPKGGGFDPGKIFDDWMSRGRGYAVISEMKKGREELELFAKENGITDGKITKDQYLKFWDQRDAIRAKLGKDPMGKKGPKNNESKKSDTPVDPVKKAADDKENEAKNDAFAEKMFQKFDTNGDGFLNEEEIAKTVNFKSEWTKWDENKDKLISMSEWKAYFKDSQLQRQKEREKRTEDGKNGKKIVITEDDDEERIVVYRLGKMPANIPDWFKDLDLDKDGQVSLFEWHKGGKDIEEFQKMDRNDDGFLTAEEVVRFQRITLEATQRTTQLTSTIKGSSTPNAQENNKENKGDKKKDFRKKKGF